MLSSRSGTPTCDVDSSTLRPESTMLRTTKEAKPLTSMDELMNYSWGPVTNRYRNFLSQCDLLFPSVRNGACKHYSHDGYTYTEDFLRGYFELRNFQAREDDVYVVSFPKTGTTWLQEIVYVIVHGLETASKANLDDRVPFFEIYPGGMKNLENHPSPRLLKSHFSYSALPSSVKQKGCKIVYITRNPKDTITSMYHFYRSLTSFQFSGSFDEFVDMFLKDQVMSAPYPDHVLDFWNRRHDDNVLFLMYEDLQEDFHREIRKIARFLGKSLSEERVDQIAHHCSFQQMSVNPATNYSHRDQLGWRNLNETKFMRKGKVGDWANLFTKEVNDRVDRWIEENFGSSDIEFTYRLPRC